MQLQSKEMSIQTLKNFKMLKLAYAKILSMFPDSYICESTFSKLNFILNQYRSNLTQKNLLNCIKIACNDSEIDFEEIVKDMFCQVSH